MKNFKKTLNFFASWACLLAVGLTVLLSSCEENEDAQNLSNGIQEVNYVSDDFSVTVKLDPNLNHDSHSFETLQEHDDYLLSLEETSQGVISLNKKMYEDLSHYFDPYQIAVIDNNYQIQVAEETYKVDQEAIYKKVNGAWELDLFYGKSGLVDLEETTLVHTNIRHLENLSDYQFKSPESERIYNREKTAFANGKMAVDSREYVYKDSNGAPKLIEYKRSQYGETFYAYIKWYCWNESYRQWGKKAKGGTETLIRRFEDGEEYVKLDNSQSIGAYLVTGERDDEGGKVEVVVDGRDGSTGSATDRWNTSKSKVKRKKNKSAHSSHSGWVRHNQTGELIKGMDKFHVD